MGEQLVLTGPATKEQRMCSVSVLSFLNPHCVKSLQCENCSVRKDEKPKDMTKDIAGQLKRNSLEANYKVVST